MNLREVTINFGRLIFFIRHDSAEIWGFRYGLKLGIGTLKIMASTGVLVRVVCALKRPISFDSRISGTILT
jgi:hypothetical protein